MFWIQVDLYEKRKESNPLLLRRQAEFIYSTYLKSTSKCPINIDSEILKEIECHLSLPTPTLFHDSQNSVFELMKNDPFRRFRLTSAYVNYKEKHIPP